MVFILSDTGIQKETGTETPFGRCMHDLHVSHSKLCTHLNSISYARLVNIVLLKVNEVKGEIQPDYIKQTSIPPTQA